MIVNSVKKSFFQIIFSPWVLLPFIAVTLLSFLITNFLTDIIQKPIIDLILYYENLTESNLLFIFLTQYPIEILTIVLIGFIGLVASSMALLALARIAKGKGLIDSINDSILDFGKAVSLSVFFFAAFIILIVSFLVISFVINFLAQLLPSISVFLGAIIFPIIIGIIIVILLVRFSFIIPALVDLKLKKALQKSWDFSSDKFWSALLLTLILVIISFIIGLIASTLVPIIGLEFESIILTAGEVISATFFGLAIANYYYAE